ncbi:hypothetical protein D3C79_640020 [compost metagenome]
MQGVGPHRRGPGQADDLVLQCQQGKGQHQRKQHYTDTDGGIAQGLRGVQAFNRLHPDQYRTDPDEQRLRHTGQGLGLAMAETVVVVGRAQGVVHGEQVEERGNGIQCRVGQPGQQADRAAQPPGQRLAQDQDAGHCQRCASGQA